MKRFELYNELLGVEDSGTLDRLAELYGDLIDGRREELEAMEVGQFLNLGCADLQRTEDMA